uniref:Uncharacterized protein n=1 Tax=Fagus sylvatica TaxID=28930 RepID=A0A2N9G6E5_FAGSY
MSRRVKRGEVGSRERKGKESDKMKGKGRAGPEVVGPRAGPSCAAHDGHARVPKTAPFHHFKPRIVFSHPDRSSPNPGIPIWTPEGLARKPRQTARQPNAEQRRGNCHNPIFTPRDFLGCRHAKRGQPEPNQPDPDDRARHIKYSQEEGPGHISQAYLGGNVCAKILSDPLQLGPRAKTLRQEVHFSYHTQLSDRQELLRSSRNLSQKLTPWHKEHSDGLRSQGSYLREPKLASVQGLVFLTRNKLICEPGHIGKKDTSMHDVELSDRQEFIGASRNPDRKTALKRTKNTPVDSARGAISHKSKLGFPRILEPCKNRQRKLSDGTKNVKIRHRELGQICARTGTRFEKKRAGSKTHFFSRTAAFARRVFPARNKLIREPGCVGKIMTPATTWNSRFADSIPRLTGIFTGKVHKNSSDTPTSGSHNSLVRTPIRMQTLYRWKEDVESFPTICRMTHFEFRKTSKTAPENRIKKGTRTEIEEDSRELLAWKDKTATWQYHNSRRTVMRRA